MSTGSGIHAGHRQRMKERFLAGGLDGFSEHEVLELILFYAIPRRDVNELSHKLVERFGSLNAVFTAGFEDLLTVDGIGENAALLIKLMAESFRRYALSDGENIMLYDTLSKVGDYAVKLYIGVSVEKLYALLFDNKMMLLDTVILGEGAINSVQVSVRTIAEKALKRDASSIILLHNHPNGLPYPSDEDKRFTSYLRDMLSNFDISLIEHIIVSGRYYRPMLENEINENNLASPYSFSYGKKELPDGVRVFDIKAASGIPYKRNAE